MGILLWPPTKITSWMSLTAKPASFSAILHGSMVRLINSSTKLSNLARVIFIAKCFGPEASIVM